MENKDTHATNNFSQTLEPCECVTRMKMSEVRADKKWTCYVQNNVRATGECVYTPSYTLLLLLHVYETLEKCRKTRSRESKIFHHFMTISSNKNIQFVVWVRWVYVQNTLQTFSDFIVSCPFWSFLLVLVPSVGFSSIIVSGGFSVSRSMRLWETDLPNLLIFDDAFVWTLSNCVRINIYVHLLDDLFRGRMMRLWRLSIMLENSLILCMYCLSL